MSRRRVKGLFAELWSNDDDQRYGTAMDVLKGRHAWLQTGVLGLDEHAEGTSAAQKTPAREAEAVGA